MRETDDHPARRDALGAALLRCVLNECFDKPATFLVFNMAFALDGLGAGWMGFGIDQFPILGGFGAFGACVVVSEQSVFELSSLTDIVSVEVG